MKYVPQTWMPNGTHITCTQSCKSSNTPNDCCSPQHVGDICTHIFMGFHTSSTRDRNWTHHQYCSIQVSFLPKDSVLKTLHLGDWWPSPPSEHRQRSDCQLRWLIACRSCQWLTTNRRPALGQRGCQVAKNCALLKHLFLWNMLGGWDVCSDFVFLGIFDSLIYGVVLRNLFMNSRFGQVTFQCQCQAWFLWRKLAKGCWGLPQSFQVVDDTQKLIAGNWLLSGSLRVVQFLHLCRSNSY